MKKHLISLYFLLSMTITSNASNTTYATTDFTDILFSYPEESSEAQWLNNAWHTERATQYLQEEISRYKLEEIEARIAVILAQEHAKKLQERRETLRKTYEELQVARSNLRISRPATLQSNQLIHTNEFQGLNVLQDSTPWSLLIDHIQLPKKEYAEYNKKILETLQQTIRQHDILVGFSYQQHRATEPHLEKIRTLRQNMHQKILANAQETNKKVMQLLEQK